MNTTSRKLLGDFLKTRRQKLSPSEYGLANNYTRRRTPGLRREEVAEAAAISTSWYTWLEQGRIDNTSPEILHQIGRALRLTEEEKQHVMLLAGYHYYTNKSREANDGSLPSSLMKMFHSVSYPVLATNKRTMEIISWNRAATLYLFDFNQLDHMENSKIGLMFLNKEFKSRIHNWDQCAQLTLAIFRKKADLYANDPWFKAFIDSMRRRSREFDMWWCLHDVGTPNDMKVTIEHPQAGSLHFQINVIQHMDEQQEVEYSIYSPLPETEERMLALSKGM